MKNHMIKQKNFTGWSNFILSTFPGRFYVPIRQIIRALDYAIILYFQKINFGYTIRKLFKKYIEDIKADTSLFLLDFEIFAILCDEN